MKGLLQRLIPMNNSIILKSFEFPVKKDISVNLCSIQNNGVRFFVVALFAICFLSQIMLKVSYS